MARVLAVLHASALINILGTHMHKDRPSVPLHSGAHWQEVLFWSSDTMSHFIDGKYSGVVYCSKLNMTNVQFEPCL